MHQNSEANQNWNWRRLPLLRTFSSQTEPALEDAQFDQSLLRQFESIGGSHLRSSGSGRPVMRNGKRLQLAPSVYIPTRRIRKRQGKLFTLVCRDENGQSWRYFTVDGAYRTQSSTQKNTMNKASNITTSIFTLNITQNPEQCHLWRNYRWKKLTGSSHQLAQAILRDIFCHGDHIIVRVGLGEPIPFVLPNVTQPAQISKRYAQTADFITMKETS